MSGHGAYERENAVRRRDPITGSTGEADDGGYGIRCSSCGHGENRVTNSRPGRFADRGSIVRTRRCRRCDYQWETWETTTQTVRVLMRDALRHASLRDLLERALEEAAQ